MFNQLSKRFVDIIYGTKRERGRYEIRNPAETVLAADASKGIITNNGAEIKRQFDWITSQRAVVLLTDKNLVCGRWLIPIGHIQSARLLKVNTLFGDGQVLIVQTKDDKIYQFGMQLNPEWTNQQVLPLTYEKGKIKHSTFSIVLRLILVAYFIYWCYERFIQP